MLTIESLESRYGDSQVLFGVSLSVRPGECIAILGRNGVGKTTLLQSVMGYMKPSGGRVIFEGSDVTGLPPEKLVRLGFGYVPQERNVFEGLTVRDNLRLGSMGRRSGKQTFDRVLELFPKLGERLAQTAGTLSGGERKMLAISRALVGDPRLLLLDEPTEGVWPAVVAELQARLRALKDEMPIVLVEQHVEMALELADRGYVMELGRVVLEGPSPALRENPALYEHLAP
jgi:branched-chain amino acid transport system ATP-binding protein